MALLIRIRVFQWHRIGLSWLLALMRARVITRFNEKLLTRFECLNGAASNPSMLISPVNPRVIQVEQSQWRQHRLECSNAADL